MKKVILGSAMLLAGVISVALVLAGAMASDWTVNGELSALWNISQYGLMPAVYAFAGIAAAGLILAVWGVVEKK